MSGPRTDDRSAFFVSADSEDPRFSEAYIDGRDNPRTAEESASGRFDTTIRGYRVNAAAAKFSRRVAAAIYGPHRAYGYLYGGSGGAYQTVTSAEMTSGVWDGFVPYVMGSPQSIPNCFNVRVHALRWLKDKWPSIKIGRAHV